MQFKLTIDYVPGRRSWRLANTMTSPRADVRGRASSTSACTFQIWDRDERTNPRTFQFWIDRDEHVNPRMPIPLYIFVLFVSLETIPNPVHTRVWSAAQNWKWSGRPVSRFTARHCSSSVGALCGGWIGMKMVQIQFNMNDTISIPCM
jgi:hypothetical protein